MNHNIIISGAGGLVATELIHLLLKDESNILFLLSTNVQKLRDRYQGISNIQCFTLSNFVDYCNCNSNVDYLSFVNTAFSRSSEGDLLASSMEYTIAVLKLVRQLKISSFINISSQSVYGQKTKPLWTEDTLLAPNYMYALGKTATEKFTEVMLEDTNIKFTNIRLTSVCENARFLNVFIKNAITNVPIRVIGGTQICSFMDARDVASALKSLIFAAPLKPIRKAYNLGTNHCYSILELAEVVRQVAKRDYNLDVSIILEVSDLHNEVGMDSSLFFRDFNWMPSVNIEGMIKSLFEYLINVDEGGSGSF